MPNNTKELQFDSGAFDRYLKKLAARGGKLKLPECYRFLEDEANSLADQATAIPMSEHMARLDACKAQVNRREYAVGGEVIHRGFFCPSPIQDIVVGNCNRGRMVKNLARTKRMIDYEYGFCDDRLLTVRRNWDEDSFDEEYLTYEGNRQIGYTIDHFGKLHYLSECVYQGNMLSRYLTILLMPNGSITDATEERYEYQSGLMYAATIYRAIGAICRHDRYIFEHDADGYLSTYQAVEYRENQEVENSYWKGHVFQVYKKRKV